MGRLKKFFRIRAPCSPRSNKSQDAIGQSNGSSTESNHHSPAVVVVDVEDVPSSGTSTPENHHAYYKSNGDLSTAASTTYDSSTTAVLSSSSDHSSHHHSKHESRRTTTKASRRRLSITAGLKRAASKLGQSIEHTLVPPMTSSHHNQVSQHFPKIKVLLKGFHTAEEHREYVATFLECVRDMHGLEGLRAVGFDYKHVYCIEHRRPSSDHDTAKDQKQRPALLLPRAESWQENPSPSPARPCQECATRLYHVEDNTLINDDNRQQYIADGDMYEETARLCQEYAQEVMIREGKLEWVTVCDDANESEPVRALVHMDHHLLRGSQHDEEDDPDERPILLVVTGKGKVRAGIFSRQHLMTTGLEASTAVPMVREAARRDMSIIILDPNARGDKRGMETFERSVELLLGHLEEEEGTPSDKRSCRSLYVVAHSASGSQLVRYLLDRIHVFAPYVRAIAFTDSTHDIQWARDNAELRQLLGSSQCVYFRSANEHRDALWHKRQAGEEVETDRSWEHRFGSIRTMWAGTKEHSLTNWFAHSHIWDHFDSHLLADPLHFLTRRKKLEDDVSPRGSEHAAGTEQQQVILGDAGCDDAALIGCDCDEAAAAFMANQAD